MDDLSSFSVRLPVADAKRFCMRGSDCGGDLECRRDAARTFIAGGIYVMTDVAVKPLVPPEGLDSPGSTNSAAVDTHIEGLASALHRALPEALSDGALERLLPCLSITPVLCALEHAGVPPTVQHRCAVLHVTKAHTLFCLNLAVVAEPPSPSNSSWGLLSWQPQAATDLLAVHSPNLLAPPPAMDPREYALTYAWRRAQRARLEEEALDEPLVDLAAPDETSLCTTALVRCDGRYVLKTIKDEACRGCEVCQPARVMDL